MEDGLIRGCTIVGVGALVSGVGCSWWDGVVLVGSSSVVGSLWHVLPVVAVLGNGVGLALDVGFTMKGRSWLWVVAVVLLFWNVLLQEFPVAKSHFAWAVYCIRTTYWSYWWTSTTTLVLSHLVGWLPVWFCMRTWCPTLRRGSFLVCSFQCSASFMCLFLCTSSWAASVSCQVGCGLYLPGRIGIKSLMGQPITHWAGDSLVLGSGVLRYCRIAHWSESVFKLPYAYASQSLALFLLDNLSVGMPHRKVSGWLPILSGRCMWHSLGTQAHHQYLIRLGCQRLRTVVEGNQSSLLTPRVLFQWLAS